jgi:hypothetical protein
MPKKNDRRDAVGRALAHHELAGRLEFVGTPSPGDPRWRVRFPAQVDTHTLTTAEAYGLSLGLAAWDRGLTRRPGRAVQPADGSAE